MPLLWIKMWLEGLDDPKLTRLSLAERGAWWGLCKLAGKREAKGKIMSSGSGLDMDEIADALHIKGSEDRQALESMIAKMEEHGSLKWTDNILEVIHYEERQKVPASARPEVVTQRVRNFRERQKSQETGPDKYREDDNLIQGQSIEKAIRIARGDLEATPSNKRMIQKELERRGIDYKQKAVKHHK